MRTQKKTGRSTRAGRSGRTGRSGSGSAGGGRTAGRGRGAGRKGAGSGRAGRRAAGRRSGGRSRGSGAKHVKYSKWIDSPDDHEDRKGQSLATRNHDVIRRWAESRKAMPSVVGDTAGRDGAGVLRIDFPGYRGKRLEKIDWDDWFDTFDKRKLVFLYQEHKRDGSPSTFFKLAA